MDTMHMPHVQALFQTFHFREQQFVFERRCSACIMYYIFCFVLLLLLLLVVVV